MTTSHMTSRTLLHTLSVCHALCRYRDASFGPTNAEVAEGVAGIWKAVPAIKIEIVDVYTQKGQAGNSNTAIANIKVIVDESTTLKVCDVITFDDDGKVVSLDAYKV